MNFIGPWSDCPPGLFYRGSSGPRGIHIRKYQQSGLLPISLEDVKEDLRVDSNDEDATVRRMIMGAAAFFEIRTGIVLTPSRFEATFDSWAECYAGEWEFFSSPLRSLIDVSYVDTSQSPPDWTEVAISDLYLQVRPRSFLLVPFSEFNPEIIGAPRGGVRVRWEAGYDASLESGDTQSSADLPDPSEELTIDPGIRTCLTMLVAHYYENRELFAADKIASIELGAGSLLGAYRQPW